MTSVRLRQKPRLRVRLRRKVARLRELRGYAWFSSPYACARTRSVRYQFLFNHFGAIQKTTSNRVTHVTAVLSRVTDGVTTLFTRNQEERVR